jgi:hypothetical protein
MIERWGPHVPSLSLVSPYAAAPPQFSPFGSPFGPMSPLSPAMSPLSPNAAGFYSPPIRHPYFHPSMVPYMKAPPLSPPEGRDIRKTSIEDLRHKARRHSATITSPTAGDIKTKS